VSQQDMIKNSQAMLQAFIAWVMSYFPDTSGQEHHRWKRRDAPYAGTQTYVTLPPAKTIAPTTYRNLSSMKR
jgi:hypothetical protein